MRIALLVFLPLLSGPVLYALRRSGKPVFRDTALAVLTGLSVLLSLSLAASAAHGTASALDIPHILVSGLSFTADGFRAAYSLITSLMWFFTTLFGREYFRHEQEGLDAYWAFTLMTLGATQGVMLSADLMTTFTFFEILSLTSFTWVMHERTPEAVYAGYTYLFVAITGGLVLLMGLLLLQRECGTLRYDLFPFAIWDADSKTLLAAAVCILFGFGAKAGMFPLHVWLPMAHPVAPSPASALLSGVLTKVGVFGILMISLEVADNRVFGLLVLSLGLVTMFLGAVLALFSVNLKRTLACSSMSQIGFILTGIGTAVLCGERTAGVSVFSGTVRILSPGTVLARSGAVLHMANHSLLKLLLFMAAGVVVMNLHALDLNDIRGWGRNKPALQLAFLSGALGISGVPLFNGYLSKSMLHEGLVHLIELEGGYFFHAAEWVFLFSGGCTFAYMLKLYICLFRESNADPDRQARFDADSYCMDDCSRAVILGSAVFPLLLGNPRLAARLAVFMTGQTAHFEAFAPENLKGAAISLGIGAAVYALFVRPVPRPGNAYADRWPQPLDLERRVYRPLFTAGLPAVCGRIAALFADNAVLRPVCRFAVFAGSVFARALSDSTDALIVFLRGTAVREVKLQDGEVRVGRWKALERATEEAFRPALENFSFALLMTCFGILIILGFLILLL